MKNKSVDSVENSASLNFLVAASKRTRLRPKLLGMRPYNLGIELNEIGTQYYRNVNNKIIFLNAFY